MHFHIEFLVEARDRLDAEVQTTEFLERYQHHEWDWYVIGGRWAGIHLPEDEQKKLGSKTKRHELDIINFTRDSDRLFTLIDDLIDSTRRELESHANHLTDMMIKAGGIDLSPLDLLMIFDAHKDKEDYIAMIPQYMKTMGELLCPWTWTNGVHFYDINSESKFITDEKKKIIRNSPDRYWLVTVDIHN